MSTDNSGGRVIGLEVEDVRFPTSSEGHGSDAMNVDPDYSAAYVRLRTDGGEDGYGLAFTIGRGNDLQCAAIEAMALDLMERCDADDRPRQRVIQCVLALYPLSVPPKEDP